MCVDPLIATVATQHAGLPFSHGGDELGAFLTCAIEHTALTSLLTCGQKTAGLT